MSIADKLQTIAENEQKVYEAGRKDEWSEFWDSFQNNGTRTWYEYSFFGVWRDEMFKPKYPIIADNATQMFARNNMTQINAPITIRGATSAHVFYGCPTTTISDLTVDESTAFEQWFLNANYLKHLTIKGVIAKDINFQYSPLTLESAVNVINRLKDYSGSDKAYTYKVTFSGTTKALLEAEGSTAPNDDTWLNYAQSKGWNV